MTTHVTPIVKPEEREVHIHLSLTEASMLGMSLGSILGTIILPEDWKALLSDLRNDLQAGSDKITKE